MGDKMTVDLGLKVLTGLLGATWQGREHVQRPKGPAMHGRSGGEGLPTDMPPTTPAPGEHRDSF